MTMENITHHTGTGHNRPYPEPTPLYKSRHFYRFLAVTLSVCVAIRFIVGE